MKFVNTSREELRLNVFDDISIVEDIIARVATDVEMRKRQRVLGAIAIFMRRVGVVKLMSWLPMFLPYMKLEFEKY